MTWNLSLVTWIPEHSNQAVVQPSLFLETRSLCFFFPVTHVLRWQVISQRQTTSWQKQHKEVRDKWGIDDENARTWCLEKNLLLVPPVARVYDCIEICFAFHKQQLQDEGKGGKEVDEADKALTSPAVILDTSQSIMRKPWSRHVRSICSGSCLYMFAEDRCPIPVEHLRLLGWIRELQTRSLSSAQIRDLAGESMACPSVAVATACLLLSLPDLGSTEEGGCPTRFVNAVGSAPQNHMLGRSA